METIFAELKETGDGLEQLQRLANMRVSQLSDIKDRLRNLPLRLKTIDQAQTVFHSQPMLFFRRHNRK
jgi:hypothetical protein